MAKSFTVSMILKASNQITAPINAAVDGVKKLDAATMRASVSLNNIGDSLIKRGKQFREMSQNIALVANGMIAGTVKVASTVEDGIRKIMTISGETMAEATRNHQKAAFDEAKRTGQRVEDVLEARYQALSRNIPMDQLNDFIRNSNDTARAGVTSIAITTKALATMKNVYSEIDSRRMGGQLALAQKFGGTDIGEISEYAGRVASVAKQAGVASNEILSMIAAGTQTGNIEETVTGMRGMFMKILKPTAQAREEMKALGIVINSTMFRTYGLDKSFQIIMASIKKKYKTVDEQTAAMGRLFEDETAYAMLLKFLGPESMAIYRAAMNGMKDDTETLTEINKRMGTSTSEETRKMRESFKELSTETGKAFAPMINDLLSGFAKFMAGIAEAIKQNEALQTVLKVSLGIIAGIAAVAWGAGAAMSFAGWAAKAFSVGLKAIRLALIAFKGILMALSPLVTFLFSPLGILLVGIPLIIYGLTKMVKHWDAVKGAIKSAGSAVYEWFLAPIGRAFKWLYDQLVAAAKWFYNLGKMIAVEIGSGIKDGVTGALDWVGDKLGIGGKVKTLAVTGIGSVSQMVPAAPTAVVPGGGSVAVDMSGMMVQVQDGTDFGKKAWGVLKPNLEGQMKDVKQNQKRTGMGD